MPVVGVDGDCVAPVVGTLPPPLATLGVAVGAEGVVSVSVSPTKKSITVSIMPSCGDGLGKGTAVGVAGSPPKKSITVATIPWGGEGVLSVVGSVSPAKKSITGAKMPCFGGDVGLSVAVSASGRLVGMACSA